MEIVAPERLEEVAERETLKDVFQRIKADVFPQVSYSYIFENETHRQSPVPLSTYLAESCLTDGSAIAAFGSASVWSTGHDDFLIETVLTRLFGAPPPRLDNLLIVVPTGEARELATLFHLAMIFGWDIECYSKARFPWCQIDHDGCLTFGFVDDDPDFPLVFQARTARELTRRRA